MNESIKVPMPTLERLSTYLRYLLDMQAKGVYTILSADVERDTGVNAAQFRKDLSFFGEFGKPGVGYNVLELQQRIARILKVHREQPVILVGAGNLGTALVGYPGLRHHGFAISAVFDNNPSKIGKRLGDLAILDIHRLKEETSRLQAKIGIITVPASEAQAVANMMVEADIKGILNFAPATLRVPEDVTVRNVYFIQELAVLSYYVARSEYVSELAEETAPLPG